MNLPNEIIEILNILEKNNHKSFIVGGFVRDALMDIKSFDVDITTSAKPDELLILFKDFNIISVNKTHGSIHFVYSKYDIQITTFRQESGYLDYRHPDTVKFTDSFEQDSVRRDFTINAIGFNPSIGFIDYFDGINDIKSKTLTCIGDCDLKFKQDPLRIIRGLRFAIKYTLTIQSETRAHMLSNSHLLKFIPKPILYKELIKILMLDNISDGIIEYYDILSGLFYFLQPMKNFNQNNRHHSHDLLTHTALVVQNTPKKEYLRLASLFHDIGKLYTYTTDKNGENHYYNHSFQSFSLAKSILKTFEIDNITYNKTLSIILCHDDIIMPTKKSIKRALAKITNELFFDLIDFKIADNLAQSIEQYNNLEKYQQTKNLATEIINNNECYTIKQLAINGNDLIELGLQGKSIKNALNDLLYCVVNEELENNKNDLIRHLKNTKKINI